MVRVEELGLGFKVFDTPGVPNKAQASSHISYYQDLLTVLPNKKIAPYNVNCKAGASIWFGALARLDFLSGDPKDLAFFVAPHVTIHRTQILKSSEVYEKHAGTLLRPTYHDEPGDVEFDIHEITLKCSSFGLINYDIVMHGIGWIGVRGKGTATFFLHLPFGVAYSIRNDPLMPFEITEKGLVRHRGNTVNARTRKNVRLAEKFELKRSLKR